MKRSVWLLPLAVAALSSCNARTGSAVGPVAAVKIATGFTRPVYMTSPPGDTTRLFVVEQHSGKIRIIKNGTVLPRPFYTQGSLATGNEQGLLGLAFHPSYASNGLFYINYTQNLNGATVIKQYHVSPSPDSADISTGTLIMTFSQPQSNHNGGWMAFGPDGFLYIGSGDGGNFGDQGTGHAPDGNAQTDSTRLGKILRISVPGAPYGIPGSNPYSGSGSPMNEFWAKGVRNPWRPSFDRGTGDFYVADVGQDDYEEVNYQPAGAAGGRNYGWKKFEGWTIYSCPGPCDSSGLTRPVYVYAHGGNPFRCSITGGYVMRDPALTSLAGTYFFADYCSNQVWSFKMAGGAVTQFTDRTADLNPAADGTPIVNITSFGEDGRGRMYFCTEGPSGDGTIYRIAPRTAAGVPGSRTGMLNLFSPEPNPGRGLFALRFELPAETHAVLRVLNASGRQVRKLADGALAPGEYRYSWDGSTDAGGRAPAGTYLVQLAANDEVRTRKLTVVR